MTLPLIYLSQHKSTSNSVRAPQKNHFGAILVGFGDTKFADTFWEARIRHQKVNSRS